jgi:hypothetical protein
MDNSQTGFTACKSHLGSLPPHLINSAFLDECQYIYLDIYITTYLESSCFLKNSLVS